ncbi:MAG: beta-phosphoglucomutase [Bacteroidetes bacterium]|nr:MAG: beta-phosphoglucomutase [Bacteroidota bacterium]
MYTIKGCLFDMDGVIVDTAKHHFTAWKALAEELSIPFTSKDNEALKGLGRLDSLEKILQLGNLELNSNTKLKLMENKNSLYLELVRSMSEEDILPGVCGLIEELKVKGIGVCLGSSSRNASIILKNIGLFNLFDGVVDGNHLTFSKPDPEVFIKGAKILELSPSNCVVFEDAVAGVEAAKSGGFFALGVGDHKELDNADAVVSDLSKMNFSKLLEIVNRND